MGSITRVFTTEANRVLVLERFEGDDGFTGHSRVYIDAGDTYFGIPYQQLHDAAAGSVVVDDDGATGHIVGNGAIGQGQSGGPAEATDQPSALRPDAE